MKQITILARSDEDTIAEATLLLANAGVNIDSITGEHYGSQAIINITVDNAEVALYALQKRLDWQIVSEDVVIVKVKDEIGALAKLAGRLAANDVMIRSIRFIERNEKSALVAVSIENTQTGRQALRDIIVG
ncbi:MAG: hypothetical protein HY370_03445 [Proteobacteria bacterium]|nr:hypothetical protein [Pseudomonadota bacterium]